MRRIRVARRKTTKQVADALGVTRQTYENWENDITQPKINQFISLCTYHCIDFSSIFSQLRGNKSKTNINGKRKHNEINRS
ncbi:helix-turn-helix transcriptional regulator [Pseudoalteromonas sp. Of11M-6]|uniref:helix-turn-helix transcriptional regulator n=1 Tax=Pseudoalteromonas sp. Of11M-6 TaxID=2917754 RepID=UPI001EF597A9|nr:helix-turn-helix transcriptional regulator [Pseudoalteromonas sp. Of11M-6]MCG7553108.1 helix-turn-helix domain-containing protein [Pseudoalteromonas sp. Of11M-6]